jgi:general secretion pathway protein D
LTEIDVIPKQIEIETRFVEVNQTDLNSIGFEYFITDDVELAQKKNQAGLPLSQRERLVLRAGAPTGGNRFLTNPDAQGSGVDALSASDNILTFASLLTNPELTMVLHALEQKGNTDLLSAPKITTKSGEEAQIKVVTEYIYPSDYTVEPGVPPTVTAAGGATTLGTPPIVTPAEFETREVGVIMNVLPEVTPDSQMISLTMSPEVVTEPEWRNFGQTFLDGAGNLQQIPIEQPFFNSRSISTSILIYNGATVVMGGMITEEREQVRDQIPVLGDIPIIGRFFRSSYDSSVKRNLLIFVTARLVGPDGRPVGGSITDSLP